MIFVWFLVGLIAGFIGGAVTLYVFYAKIIAAGHSALKAGEDAMHSVGDELKKL